MRIRTVVGALIGVFMLFALATPAAAQVDFAAGYQFLRFLDDDGLNIPTGWGLSIAGGTSDRIKIVGDIGGHYPDGGGELHTFQGGLEVAGNRGRLVPYVRVLAGLGRFSGGGDGLNTFAFTPEAGVKIMGTERVGAQVAVGFPIFTREGNTESSLRLFFGIVIRGK